MKNWFKFKTNEHRKYRKALIKSAKKYCPWDFSFILDILERISEWNELYYKKHGQFVSSDITVRDMILMQKLCKIIKDETPLFEYDESGKSKQMLVKVNLRNHKRFSISENLIFLQKFPEELYILKAQNLLGKLISYRLTHWWN